MNAKIFLVGCALIASSVMAAAFLLRPMRYALNVCELPSGTAIERILDGRTGVVVVRTMGADGRTFVRTETLDAE